MASDKRKLIIIIIIIIIIVIIIITAAMNFPLALLFCECKKITKTRLIIPTNRKLIYVILRTVPTIVIAHTFCASPDTPISYRQCLLRQGYFCAV